MENTITMSVTQLLSKVKFAKTKLEAVQESFIDIAPDDRNSRLLLSIYNSSTGCTLNGNSIEDTKGAIVKIDNLVSKSINEYIKLNAIKDEINSSTFITIPGYLMPDGKDTKVSISTALLMTSSKVQNFVIGYLDRLSADKVTVEKALEQHQRTSLSQDKIDMYVNAKMNSLNIKDNTSSSKLYNDFAKEYIDANKFILLDPLSITSSISDRKLKAVQFFDTVYGLIKESNATTKIWIDLNTYEWRFVNFA